MRNEEYLYDEYSDLLDNGNPSRIRLVRDLDTLSSMAEPPQYLAASIRQAFDRHDADRELQAGNVNNRGWARIQRRRRHTLAPLSRWRRSLRIAGFATFTMLVGGIALGMSMMLARMEPNQSSIGGPLITATRSGIAVATQTPMEALPQLETSTAEPIRSTQTITQPTQPSQEGSFGDHVSFVDHLRARGLVVEPLGEVNQSFLKGNGVRLRVSGGELKRPFEVESYDYNDEDLGTDGLRAAEADMRAMEPVGQPKGMSTLWVEAAYFFHRERVIVVYAGDDPNALGILSDLLGPPAEFDDAPTKAGDCARSVSSSEWPAPPLPLHMDWIYDQTLAESVEKSAAIAHVRVTSVERGPNIVAPEHPYIDAEPTQRIGLELLRPLKGELPPTVELSKWGSNTVFDTSDPPYQVCEQYVLFLVPVSGEKNVYQVLSPAGRLRVEAGKLETVLEEGDGVPKWLMGLRGKSVAHLEQALAESVTGTKP